MAVTRAVTLLKNKEAYKRDGYQKWTYLSSTNPGRLFLSVCVDESRVIARRSHMLQGG